MKTQWILTLNLIAFSILFIHISAQTPLGDNVVGIHESGWFGNGVALSNNGYRLVAGAPNFESGVVRAFDFVNGEWIQIGSELTADDFGDHMGYQVAISHSGHRIAIGIRDKWDPVSYAGEIRVYEYLNNDWVQVGQDMNGLDNLDYFGLSVDLSADGNIVIGGGSGLVRVFEYVGSQWVQKGGAFMDRNQYFGNHVACSDDGNIIAFRHGEDNGMVNVFQFVNDDWVQLGDTLQSDTVDNTFAGWISLSSDGHTLALGSIGLNGVGGVLIYEFSQGVWTQKGNTILGSQAREELGSSVYLSDDGNILATGAYWYDSQGLSANGRVQLYEFVGSDWNQIGDDIVGENHIDYCGYDVSLSGDGKIIAVGSPVAGNVNSDQNGDVRVFTMDNSPVINKINYEAPPAIFPNPSSHEFNIEFAKNVEEIELRIYNSQGKLVLSNKYENTNVITDLILKLPGIYQLHVISKDKYFRPIFYIQS